MNRLAPIALLFAIACGRGESPKSAIPGDAERGRQLIAQHGCNVCHLVPGVRGVQGALGPPLIGVTARPTMSRGVVRNTPENLVRFIQDPASLNPATTMPRLIMPAADAQDIAAYLSTLH